MLATSVIGSKWKIAEYVDSIPLRIRIRSSLVKVDFDCFLVYYIFLLSNGFYIYWEKASNDL